jgi:hypothetical protein
MTQSYPYGSTYNTISDRTYRDKYMSSRLQEILKTATVAEKICQVDRSDNLRIQNPYGGTPTALVTGITGTYSVENFTTTNDALTVAEQVAYGEHIYDFQKLLTQFDLFASRTDAIMYAMAKAADIWVLNVMCEAGTGTYSTPSGGFTTASNISTILANLGSKFLGYAQAYQGLFLVVEAADTVGFTIAQMTNGFNYADAAWNNGFMTSAGGFEIYVVPDGTFTTVATADTTSGTQTWSNSSHRVAGVKGMVTYAAPRGLMQGEKEVSGKSGSEIYGIGYIGAKVWTAIAGLVIDITIA